MGLFFGQQQKACVDQPILGLAEGCFFEPVVAAQGQGGAPQVQGPAHSVEVGVELPTLFDGQRRLQSIRLCWASLYQVPRVQVDGLGVACGSLVSFMICWVAV